MNLTWMCVYVCCVCVCLCLCIYIYNPFMMRLVCVQFSWPLITQSILIQSASYSHNCYAPPAAMVTYRGGWEKGQEGEQYITLSTPSFLLSVWHFSFPMWWNSTPHSLLTLHSRSVSEVKHENLLNVERYNRGDGAVRDFAGLKNIVTWWFTSSKGNMGALRFAKNRGARKELLKLWDADT